MRADCRRHCFEVEEMEIKNMITSKYKCKIIYSKTLLSLYFHIFLPEQTVLT